MLLLLGDSSGKEALMCSRDTGLVTDSTTGKNSLSFSSKDVPEGVPLCFSGVKVSHVGVQLT